MFGMELRSQKRWNGLAFCLFWVFVSGLVAHGYAYFNASFSHDALFQLSADDHLWQLSLGRFLQPVVRAIRGQISSPWLLGALSLLYIALAAWLIVSLLELRSPLWRALTCAVLTVNTTVTLLNATYLPWVDMFMLSMLLAVAAVYLFERRGRAGFFGGAACMCASLALYQSYVSMTIALFLLLFVDRALQGGGHYPPKALLIFIGKAALMTLLGAVLYWGGVQALLRIFHTELSQAYNGIGDVFNLSLAQIPRLFGQTYWRFLRRLALPSAAQPLRCVAVNLLLAVLCAILFIRRALRARPGWKNVLLAGLGVFFLPFALNLSYFLSKGVQHDLMIYCYALFYVMALFFEQRETQDVPSLPQPAARPSRARGALCAGTALALCVLLFSNVVYANGAYLKKDLEAESFDMLMARVLDRVEQVEGYVPGETPVALLGAFSESPLLGEHAFSAYSQTGLSHRTPITYIDTYEAYFRKKLGYNLLLASDEDMRTISQSPEALSMDVFPAAGSVKMVDGYVYVRVSAPAED